MKSLVTDLQGRRRHRRPVNLALSGQRRLMPTPFYENPKSVSITTAEKQGRGLAPGIRPARLRPKALIDLVPGR